MEPVPTGRCFKGHPLFFGRRSSGQCQVGHDASSRGVRARATVTYRYYSDMQGLLQASVVFVSDFTESSQSREQAGESNDNEEPGLSAKVSETVKSK